MTCKIKSKHGLLQLPLSESCCVVLNYLSSTLILKLSPVVTTLGEYSNMSESDQKRFGGTLQDLP